MCKLVLMFLTPCERSSAAASRWKRPIGLNRAKTRSSLQDVVGFLTFHFEINPDPFWYSMVSSPYTTVYFAPILFQHDLQWNKSPCDVSVCVVIYRLARSPPSLSLLRFGPIPLSVSSCAFSAVWLPAPALISTTLLNKTQILRFFVGNPGRHTDMDSPWPYMSGL